MLSILGRLLTIAGAAIIVYSLFMTIIVMGFPVEFEVGGIVVNHEMQMEASLYDLGSKLSEMNESMQDPPRILDYLWLIFAVLAFLNFALALKPSFPKILRVIIALSPLVLLIAAVYSTGTNPQMALGFERLFEFLVSGFYILLAGCLVVLVGSLMTGRKVT